MVGGRENFGVLPLFILLLLRLPSGLKGGGSSGSSRALQPLEQFILDNRLNKCSPADEAAIGTCLDPILQYANKIQAQNRDASKHFLTFQKNSNIIRKLCSLYAKFGECTKPIDCASLSRKAVDASYGFMCGSGYDLFEKHADCFAEVEDHPGYLECKGAANQAIEDATVSSRESGDLNDHLSKLCKVMNEYLSCCQPFVYNRCGPEAWRLVSKITMDSLQVFCPNLVMN